MDSFRRGARERLAGRAAAALLGAALLASAAAAGPGDVARRLRSRDAADRRKALAELVAAPDGGLPDEGRSLRLLLEKLLDDDPDPRVRGLAAAALARVAGDASVGPLLEALRDERDPEAARQLPRAFRHLGGRAARDALVAAASDGRDLRRGALCAEALGELPGEEPTAELLALLEASPPWPVASAVCLALGTRRRTDVPAALVLRLRHPDASVRSAARESLVRLCGLDHGTDPAPWEAWWDSVRDGFGFPAAPADEEAPDDPSRTSDAWRDRPTHARFFGIELRGRRVAFVVDYSQSMWGARRDRAQQELIDAVKGLPSSHTFAVVLFNERVWWFRDGPLPARPQEKLDLAAYLPEQETKSYTNLHDALEQALGLSGAGAAARDPAPGVDEIVLLSDGVPNRGRLRDEERILDAVRALCGGRVAIHTVSLGDEPTTLLPRLAAENGGRHVAHPFPK